MVPERFQDYFFNDRDYLPETYEVEDKEREQLIRQRGGSLPFTDRADPDKIRAEVHMSKNEFKRAVGHLLKAGKVKILPDSIVLTKTESGQG